MWLEISIIVLLILTWCWSSACTSLIRSYHESKPLGLQTIFGKVVCILMGTLQCVSGYHGLVYLPCCIVGLSGDKKNVDFVKTLAALSFISIQAGHSALCLALITKYMSIYHSNFIYALDEDSALIVVKLVMAIVPLTLTIIQFSLLSDIKQSISYMPLVENLMSSSQIPPETESIKVAGFIVFFALTFFLYGRLEYEENHFRRIKKLFACLKKNRVGPQNACGQNEANNQNSEEVEYKLSVLRIGLLLMSIFGILTLLIHAGNITVILLSAYTIANVVFPTIFISNHSALRQHALTKMLSILYPLRQMPA